MKCNLSMELSTPDVLYCFVSIDWTLAAWCSSTHVLILMLMHCEPIQVFNIYFVRKHLVSSWCPSCRFKDRQMCINDWLYFARFVSTVLCYCFDMSTSWSCYMYMFTRKYLYILYPTSLIVSHWHFEIRQAYIKAKWLGSTSVCL